MTFIILLLKIYLFLSIHIFYITAIRVSHHPKALPISKLGQAIQIPSSCSHEFPQPTCEFEFKKVWFIFSTRLLYRQHINYTDSSMDNWSLFNGKFGLGGLVNPHLYWKINLSLTGESGLMSIISSYRFHTYSEG